MKTLATSLQSSSCAPGLPMRQSARRGCGTVFAGARTSTAIFLPKHNAALLLPVFPSHALLAAPRRAPAGHLQRLLSEFPLPGVSEAVYGIQICLWPRPGEDLTDP